MKNKYLKYIPFLVLIVVISLSIAYSAFKHELLIEDTIADVRIQKNIRVTDFNLYNFTNNATSSYEEYNHNAILTNINLPNQGSTITYKVEVTNFGNVEMGIYELTNLPDNLTYELENYGLKSKICNSNNKCTLGVVKEFYFTIKYKENGYDKTNTKYNLNVGLDFQRIYTITYEGISNNNYPTEVIEKDIITINFPESINKVQVYENEVRLSNPNDYTYENNNLLVKEVHGNIKIEYIEKVYLAYLSDGSYFKEEEYIDTITTVSFVDYIDTSSAVKTYNLEENNGTNIIGWLEENESGHDLYIGSYWDIYTRTLQNAFKDMSSVTNITFNNLNTSENTSFYSTFQNLSSLKNIDLSSFKTSKVTNMANMFYGMSSLTALDVSKFDTTNVTNMAAMFQSVKTVSTLDVSKFNTSKVTNMTHMFDRMSALTSLDVSNFNTANVSNMAYMFQSLENVTILNVSNFNTSKVTRMDYMFSGMVLLENLIVTNFDTTNVTRMESMFQNLSLITELDVSDFDTSKVTNMSYMFQNVKNVTSLDVTDFDTSSVTTMKCMFSSMSALTTLDVSNFDTSKVTDMSYMFYYLKNLSSLNVSNFNTSQVTAMHYMFSTMTTLVELDLSNFDTSNVLSTGSMFSNNNNLIKLDIRNVDFSNVTSNTNMFYAVNSNINIIVKDDTQKSWVQNILGEGKGNVVTVAEL